MFTRKWFLSEFNNADLLAFLNDLSASVISVNVGLPREVVWRGEPVTTGIFKEPVSGPVRAVGINLEGDRQADLTVHGGADKAVYVYPAEHYPYWQEELGRELPWGMFGENLTVDGAPLEDDAGIGDRLRIGSAEFLVDPAATAVLQARGSASTTREW